MSKQNFTIIKTVPGTVLFTLHPVSNPSLQRLVKLTARNPKQALPADWAMGVFADPGIYALYERKAFTFDDNDSAVKMAFEKGVYFDDKLDFEPAPQDLTNVIFSILQGGNRAAILKSIEDYGNDLVKDVAIAKANDLTQSVIRMLENIFKIQLTIDGE